MYLWHIDAKRCETNTNENQEWKITLYCNFSGFYTDSPFDHMIFTPAEDNWIIHAKRVETEGEEYKTVFFVYENNLAKLINVLMRGRVVGFYRYFTNNINHIIDGRDIDIYPSPWGRYADVISCLRKINDLMFDTLLV